MSGRNKILGKPKSARFGGRGINFGPVRPRPPSPPFNTGPPQTLGSPPPPPLAPEKFNRSLPDSESWSMLFGGPVPPSTVTHCAVSPWSHGESRCQGQEKHLAQRPPQMERLKPAAALMNPTGKHTLAHSEQPMLVDMVEMALVPADCAARPYEKRMPAYRNKFLV